MLTAQWQRPGTSLQRLPILKHFGSFSHCQVTTQRGKSLKSYSKYSMEAFLLFGYESNYGTSLAWAESLVWTNSSTSQKNPDYYLMCEL